MSLRRNILANYVSQIYVTSIGIIIVPLYISYMGPEAFGLVGFFIMLQAWFKLLDMGLTPTVLRETARYRGGATDVLSYRRLTRALEGIFMCVALVGGLLLYLASNWIATHWLDTLNLPIHEVISSLKLIALIVAMRWMCGLYHGIISGSEQLVWLGVFNAAIASLRFILVLPMLAFFSSRPSAFFSFQLIVAILELFVLVLFAYRVLPRVQKDQKISWNWVALKPVMKFSLSITITASVWVMLTQTDKLILSKMLPLAEYGYFTLAVLIAGGIVTLSSPISGAILPRMTNLEAAGDHEGLITIYKKSTRLVTYISSTTGVFLCFFATPILLAWTGNKELTDNAAPILRLYALGNSFLVLYAFTYYLQYAKGDLKLHVIGNILFVIFLVPIFIFMSKKYGAVGTGYTWAVMNILFLIFWTPLVHKRLAVNIHFNWMFMDIILPIVPSLILSSILYFYFGEVGVYADSKNKIKQY